MMAKNTKFKYDFKFYIFLIIFLLVVVSGVSLHISKSFAETKTKYESVAHLDEIEEYTIKIAPRQDGTLDMVYHIKWKVLDDKTEGPLTYVRIGIPNSHVDEIQSASAHIKDISYYNVDGDYVRIDFMDKYYAGQSVNIDFSIHQSYMYSLNEDICTYYFTPGWFDEIDVDKLEIFWKSKDVFESTSYQTDGDYLLWQSSLKAGEKLTIAVKYKTSSFANLDSNRQSSNANDDGGKRTIIIIIIVVVVIGLIIFLACYFGDNYHSGSGFGGGGSSYVHVVHSSCAHSSCACVSSCACACACAGGGRAGCSKKDFYSNKNIKIKDLQKALEK